jgi:hypothetical protein
LVSELCGRVWSDCHLIRVTVQRHGRNDRQIYAVLTCQFKYLR